MPAVVPVVVGAVVSSAAGGVAGAILGAAAAYSVSHTVGLQKRPKTPTFETEAQGRTQVIRSATAPRQVVYGETIMSGPLVFAATTGDKNEFLHLVIPLAGHEVEEIGQVYFNDKPAEEYDQHDQPIKYQVVYGNPNMGSLGGSPQSILYSVTVDGVTYTAASLSALAATLPTANYTATVEAFDLVIEGNTPEDSFQVTAGSWTADYYAGEYYSSSKRAEVQKTQASRRTYRISKHLGTTTQTADADLVAEVDEWTTDHRLQGVAYLYIRLQYDPEIWPTGIPNIKAVVKGKKVYDPRTTLTAWSDNWALCVRDYLTSTAYGVGAGSSEIDSTALIAAANIADESVAAHSSAINITASVASGSETIIQCGRPVPTGASVTISGHSDAAVNGTHTVVRPHVVPFDVDQSGFVISLSATGGTGGSFTVSQKRYTCNGAVSTDSLPASVIPQLLTAGVGTLTYTQGTYKLYAGAYTASIASLNEDNLRGPISVRPTAARKDLFNAVRGVHLSPANVWQSADFPSVASATYATQDGETIYRDIELPYTSDEFAAQRIAKLILERSRQGITVQYPANLSALEITVGSTIDLTIDKFGWTNKEFRVLGWDRNHGGGIDLTLQEEAAAVYSWSSSDAVVVDPAPNTNLPDPFVTAAPTNLRLETVPASATSASGTTARTRQLLMWDDSDSFVIHYELQYREHGTAFFRPLGTASGTQHELKDLLTDYYDFRVRAISTLAVPSAWETLTNQQVAGYSPGKPPNVAGLELDGLGSTEGQGNATEFTGRHAKVRWRKSVNLRTYELDAGPYGGDSGNGNPYFAGYVVRMYKSGALVRRDKVLDEYYAYTFEKNAEDGLSREFEFRVTELDITGQESALPAILSVSNPAPSLPTGISLRANFRTLYLNCTPPSDLDYAGLRIYIGTSSGFPRNASTLVYDTKNLPIVIDQLADGTPLSAGTTYYVVIVPYDDFGTYGAESVELSATTLKIDGEFDIEYQSIKTAQLGLAIIGDAHIDQLTVEAISSGSWEGKYIDLAANGAIRSGKTSYSDVSDGWWIGDDSGTPKLAYSAGSDYFNIDGSTIEFSGTFYAGTISASAFHAGSSTFGNSGIQIEYNSGSPRLYAGDGDEDYIQYTASGGWEMGLDVETRGMDAYNNTSFYFHSFMHSLDGLQVTGAPTEDKYCIKLAGGDAVSLEPSGGIFLYSPSFSKKLHMKCRVGFTGKAYNPNSFEIYAGQSGGKRIGFKLTIAAVGIDVYGVVHNGTTLTTVALGSGAGLLRFEFTPGVGVTFYNGSTSGSITTNLPSGDFPSNAVPDGQSTWYLLGAEMTGAGNYLVGEVKMFNEQ